MADVRQQDGRYRRQDLHRQGRTAGMADARACQSPRPRHRRDRNRQDRLAAGDGGRICARRRSGLRGRHQGRPLRHRRGRRGQGFHRQAGQPRWGSTFQPDQFSTVFWDVFGEQGHPVRATVTEMGPLLLSRMLDLNDVQEGVLNVAFRVADENGLTLIDMKDLRALLDAIVPAPARRPRMPRRTRWRRSGRRRRASATSPRPPSEPSSASFWCWRTRAAPNSSASRR